MKHAPRGISLIEVMAGAALLAIVSVGLMSLTKILGKQQTQSNTTFQVSQVTRNFTTSITTGVAWAATLNDAANVSLTCLRNSTACAPTGGPIRILDPSGAPLYGYDPLASPTAGFTQTGIACNAFSAASGAGSDACPFRLDLTWTPVCPAAGPCINPSARIRGNWRYNPATTQRTIAFNTANYDFTTTRSRDGGSWVPVVCAGKWSYLVGSAAAPNDGQSCCRVQGNLSPTQVCQAAGYTAATSACRGISVDPAFAGPVTFEGSNIANNSGGPVGPGWYYACLWGGMGLGAFRVSIPAEILCQ